MSKNSEYWAKRMDKLQNQLMEQAYKDAKRIEKEYEKAISQVEKDVAHWFQRLADNNEVTLKEVRKMLDTKALKEFRWTLEEYIKYGEENALDKKWIKELENASAKVHISWLEAIKLQLQQQAERLAAETEKTVEEVLKKTYEEAYYKAAFEIQKDIGIGVAVDDLKVKSVLSKPWTPDGETFSKRVWKNQEALVNKLNTEMTQMIVRGEKPDRIIKQIAHDFEVDERKASRLVMTEAAAFSGMALYDCFKSLDVERYVFVATLDSKTCPTCGSIDGMVFEMSQHEIGATAPPLHPWCRCAIAPYYEELEGVGRRFARDLEDGKGHYVPRDMKYSDWKKTFVSKGKANTSSGVKNRSDARKTIESLGEINNKTITDALENEFGKLQTQEVILTPKMKQHIKKRHPEDWKLFRKYQKEMLSDPTYVIEDGKNKGTVFVINEIPDSRVNMILRLALETDEKGYKNSVITFYRIRESGLKKMLKNNKVIYKKE